MCNAKNESCFGKYDKDNHKCQACPNADPYCIEATGVPGALPAYENITLRYYVPIPYDERSKKPALIRPRARPIETIRIWNLTGSDLVLTVTEDRINNLHLRLRVKR